jgi:Gametolysin peptidase M11
MLPELNALRSQKRRPSRRRSSSYYVCSIGALVTALLASDASTGTAELNFDNGNRRDGLLVQQSQPLIHSRVLPSSSLPESMFSSRYLPSSLLPPPITVKCRVTMIGTMLLRGGGSSSVQEQISCIPIIDHRESDDLFPLVGFPDDTASAYQEWIEHGDLYAVISDVVLVNSTIQLSSSSLVTAVDMHATRNRREVRRLNTGPAIGTLTLVIVRVSTVDSSPMASIQDIQQVLFSSDIGFKSQYSACSFGQLNWEPAPNGDLDLFLPEPISSYASASDLVNAAQEKIRNDGIALQVSDLADKVMFCLPPGTGDWAASAGVGHWRAQFNNEWCTSLSATIHEFGHAALGLSHSNENGIPYADQTDYMSAGFTNSTWPRKCFNGQKNWMLGWYSQRSLTIDPFAMQPTLVKLATFVDYDKAQADEPVLVNVANTYYVQYNVAKGFNIDVNEKQNQLTVTEEGPSGSESRGGLSVGGVFEIENFLFSGRNLVIQACTLINGTENAEVMVVSIGMDESVCNDAFQSPSPSPSVAPSTIPTLHPTKIPTLPPTLHPTTTPTEYPTRQPTLVPSSAPTRVPTLSPTALPTVAPSRPPTLSPTHPPTTPPTVRPTHPPTYPPTGMPTILPSHTPTYRPSRLPPSTIEPNSSVAQQPYPTLGPVYFGTPDSPLQSPTLGPVASLADFGSGGAAATLPTQGPIGSDSSFGDGSITEDMLDALPTSSPSGTTKVSAPERFSSLSSSPESPLSQVTTGKTISANLVPGSPVFESPIVAETKSCASGERICPDSVGKVCVVVRSRESAASIARNCQNSGCAAAVIQTTDILAIQGDLGFSVTIPVLQVSTADGGVLVSVPRVLLERGPTNTATIHVVDLASTVVGILVPGSVDVAQVLTGRVSDCGDGTTVCSNGNGAFCFILSSKGSNFRSQISNGEKGGCAGVMVVNVGDILTDRSLTEKPVTIPVFEVSEEEGLVLLSMDSISVSSNHEGSVHISYRYTDSAESRSSLELAHSGSGYLRSLGVTEVAVFMVFAAVLNLA